MSDDNKKINMGLLSGVYAAAITVVGASINDSDIGDVNNAINQAQATELISTDAGSANKAYVSIYGSEKPLGKEMSFSTTVLRQYVSKAEIPVQSEMQCVTEGTAYIAQNSDVLSDFATIACGSDDGSVNNYSCTIPKLQAFENTDSALEVQCTKDIGIMVMNDSDESQAIQTIDIS